MRSCISRAPPTWSRWAWLTMTYLTLARIEAELRQAADDRVLRRVFVERIDQDDALAGGQRPRRMDLGADEIEIVEHLGRIGDIGARDRAPAPGATSPPGAVCGATQMRASVPVKSNAAAFFAAARCASISSADCARAGEGRCRQGRGRRERRALYGCERSWITPELTSGCAYQRSDQRKVKTPAALTRAAAP